MVRRGGQSSVGAVRTASQEQARRIMYVGNTQVWRVYELQLRPLKNILAV